MLWPRLVRLSVVVAVWVVCGLLTVAARAADDYQLGPDSQRQPDVPRGQVTEHHWKSKIFPGTERDYWVYVPAQYEPDEAGLRDGVSGRRQLRERGRAVPRADRVRQSDPQAAKCR